jgi:hypothetical protein
MADVSTRQRQTSAYTRAPRTSPRAAAGRIARGARRAEPERVCFEKRWFPLASGVQDVVLRGHVAHAKGFVVEIVTTRTMVIVPFSAFVDTPTCQPLELNNASLEDFKWPIGTELMMTFDEGISGVAEDGSRVDLSGQEARAEVIHHLEVRGERWYVVWLPDHDNPTSDENWWAAFDVRKEVDGGLRERDDDE